MWRQRTARSVPISSLTHGAVDAFRSIGDFATDLVDADHQARRHRSRALGQDGVHHRARAQSHRGGAHAVLRRRGAGPRARAPISSRSPTIRCRASIMSGTWPISPPTPPRWPESTRRISQLRLTIEYEPHEILEAAARPRPPQHRHRRLSRRMAARPAAAPARLSRSGRGPRSKQSRAASRKAAAKGWHAALAEIDPAVARRRDGRAAARRSVQGVSARYARRRSRALDAAAGPLPHAGRSRRLARRSPSHRSTPRARRASRAARSWR